MANNNKDWNMLRSVGRRVAEKRKEMGLTQDEFADEYGYARTTLAKLESGTRDLKSTEILKLAEQLNVSCDYLLGRSMVEAPNEITQEAVIRYGLSEKALWTLQKLSGSTKIDSIPGFDQMTYGPENNKNALNMLEVILTAHAENGKTYGEQILQYIYNHCYEMFGMWPMVEITTPSERVTVEDLKDIQIFRLNKVITELKKHIKDKGGDNNGQHP